MTEQESSEWRRSDTCVRMTGWSKALCSGHSLAWRHGFKSHFWQGAFEPDRWRNSSLSPRCQDMSRTQRGPRPPNAQGSMVALTPLPQCRTSVCSSCVVLYFWPNLLTIVQSISVLLRQVTTLWPRSKDKIDAITAIKQGHCTYSNMEVGQQVLESFSAQELHKVVPLLNSKVQQYRIWVT